MSLKNNFALNGKRNWQGSANYEEKIVFTCREISCPLAIMSSFSQNYSLLIPIMVSTSTENALAKKILFLLGRKFIFTSQVKDIEKYVSTIWKSCFHFKKSLKILKKIGVHQQEYDSFLKNGLLPNLNNSFHLQKKTRNKKIDRNR